MIIRSDFPDVKRGDIVITQNPSRILGTLICGVEKFWAVDDEALGTHALFMISNRYTMEVVWKVMVQDFAQAYAGKHVLIGRHRHMNDERFLKGIRLTKPMVNLKYPKFRLLLFLIPPLAKYWNPYTGSTKYCSLVCSEFTGLFLTGCGLFSNFKGLTPDNLGDIIRISKYFDIIWDDILPYSRQENSIFI